MSASSHSDYLSDMACVRISRIAGRTVRTVMSLKQAIEHAEKVADEKLKNAEFIKNNPYGDKSKIQGCVECADEHRQLVAWLRELQERRKAPEIIFCHECKHWKDSDGVYRRGISAESKCPVNSRQVYEGTFFCGMAERKTE